MLLVVLLSACGASNSEIENSLSEYKDNLQNLYNELNDKYDNNPTKDDWDKFSKDWMPKLSNAKPSELNEELSDDYANKMAQLQRVNGDMMYLWNEYNTAITEEDKDEERIKSLKDKMEENLKNIE